MVARWKDTPQIWEDMYNSNITSSLDNFGFSGINSIRNEVVEQPLVMKGFAEQVQEFWKQFAASRPNVTNEPKYALQGIEDVFQNGNTLVLKTFLTDYATVRFKNTRDDQANSYLTSEQQEFLDNYFLTLGVVGYVQDPAGRYLLGERSDIGAREGLLENVPKGLVDPVRPVNTKNVIAEALKKELREETALNSYDHIDEAAVTHLNLGPKYGDFTVIYQLKANHQAIEAIKANPREHKYIGWHDAHKLKAMLTTQRYNFNPVTVALLEKIL